VPYLTPDSIPEESDCRSLFIPASSDWLAIVSGALTELTKTWNWQQGGAVTVPEAVALMQGMIDAYYDGCAACTTPGGYRVIRIGIGGHIEELNGDGEWVEPTGDYIIPPPDAREGGTEADQICLAAKNAVNVMEQLYETLTEAWASHLSEAEAITEFILAIVALVGFEFAPITWAIVAFFGAIFALLYTALEYLGADLWDEAFSKQITCFLTDCASNDAGVVTFDWDCFNAHLNTLANDFLLSETQLRLYVQVGYMLYFMGGGDALNLAGATTEITNDDCSFCEPGWCVYFDFTVSDWDWTVYGGVGAYVPGVGFQSHDYGTESDLLIQLPLGVTTSLGRSVCCYTSTEDCGQNLGYYDGTFHAFTLPQFLNGETDPTIGTVMPYTTTIDVDNIYYNESGAGGKVFTLKALWIYGDFNPKPEIGSECPEEECP